MTTIGPRESPRTRERASAAMRKPKAPAQSRADILAAATHEFAERGVKGARMDAIAKRTRTTRAMIYYYFGSRETLYAAVLESVYRGIRAAEKSLELAHVPPMDALRRLVTFVFDYYQAHPDFVALVVAENQAGGKNIRKMHRMRTLNLSIIDTMNDVLTRGASKGVFRPGMNAVDLHMAISALGFFQIANRHTFGYIFKRDLGKRENVARNRALITEMIVRFVEAPAAP